MKRNLSEDEYRFDLVLEEELGDCLCWESIRELCCLHGKPVPAPWRQLDAEQRDTFNILGKLEASFGVSPFFDPFPDKYKVTVDGKELTSIEWVDLRLRRVPMNWECSDKELLDIIRRHLAEWLKEQRRNNPNARFFSEKGRLGRRQKLLPLLADLAVYRLKQCDWSEQDIDVKLQLLYAKIHPEAVEKATNKGVLIKSGKVGNRNLTTTCRRAKKALKGFERSFSNYQKWWPNGLKRASPTVIPAGIERWTPKTGPLAKIDFRRSAGDESKQTDESETQTT